MLVGQIMSQKIVTISPDKRVGQALQLMQKHQIRHVPVMMHDRMVGWITSRDLREVLLASMLEEIKVGDVMVQAPISVTPDTEVEEAARLIHEHKIGGMPVMEGDKLVGVITMQDLISAFITMLGLLKSSSRLDLLLPNRSEALDAAAHLIKKAGGKVINVALGPIQGEKRPYYFRLEKVSLEPIVSTLKQQGYEVLDTIA
ncbi:MAG: CBS and ACT domain-containing protein [Deltaproteobacteria bacterium]|nr:CBS and ACT domain-containing protein [Deltaproteobacteria bacterium]